MFCTVGVEYDIVSQDRTTKSLSIEKCVYFIMNCRYDTELNVVLNNKMKRKKTMGFF